MQSSEDGLRLTTRDYETWQKDNPAEPELRQIVQVFSDWRGACLAAGLKNPKGRSGLDSVAAVELSMQLMRERVGENITLGLWERERKRDPRIVPLRTLKRIYGSQRKAAEAFDMHWGSTHSYAETSDAEIVEMVKRVCDEAGGPLSVRAYNARRDKGRTPPDLEATGLIVEWARRGNGRWPELLAAAGHPPE